MRGLLTFTCFQFAHLALLFLERTSSTIIFFSLLAAFRLPSRRREATSRGHSVSCSIAKPIWRLYILACSLTGSDNAGFIYRSF